MKEYLMKGTYSLHNIEISLTKVEYDFFTSTYKKDKIDGFRFLLDIQTMPLSERLHGNKFGFKKSYVYKCPDCGIFIKLSNFSENDYKELEKTNIPVSVICPHCGGTNLIVDAEDVKISWT